MPIQNNKITKVEQYIDGTDLVTITTVRENLQDKKDVLDIQVASAVAQKDALTKFPPLPATLSTKADNIITL